MEELPRFSNKMSTARHMVLFAILPFTLIYCLYFSTIGLKYQKNCYKNKETMKKLSIEKVGCFSKDIDIDLLKSKAKDNKATLNDLLMAVIGLSLKQYAKKAFNDNKLSQLTCTMPFSLRTPPKHPSDFKFHNNFSMIPIDMPIEETYEKALASAKRITKSWKTSPIPFALVYFVRGLLLLPLFAINFLLCDWADRMTFTFSNVPGPRKHYIVNGKKAKSMGFLVPALKSLMGGISIISYVDRIKIGIISDKGCIPVP